MHLRDLYWCDQLKKVPKFETEIQKSKCTPFIYASLKGIVLNSKNCAQDYKNGIRRVYHNGSIIEGECKDN